MVYPIIYSNKKHVTSGEEVVFTKGPWISGGDGVFSFPNLTIGTDYTIVSGDMYSDVMVVKFLKNLGEVRVDCIINTNNLKNSYEWGSFDGMVASGWYAPSATQINTIEVDGIFEGNSQKIQTLEIPSYIYQENVVNNIDTYQLSLKYLASEEVLIKAGGKEFILPATDTESTMLPVYIIPHTAGIVDITVLNIEGVKWILSDGTFSTESRIRRQLPEGVSYLMANNFSGSTISFLGTGPVYIGSLSDVPKNVFSFEARGSGISGNISELDHIGNSVIITDSANISGEVRSLSGIPETLILSGCPNISGSISLLRETLNINLNGTSVSGFIPSTAKFTHINLNNTNLSKSDIENTLYSTANRAMTQNIQNGRFECWENMPIIQQQIGFNAIKILQDRNWTVLVNWGTYL